MVRRTAENFICDEDDWETIHAKQGINEKDNLHHRRMSNNSIAFEKKPTREKLHYLLDLIKNEGEPGFYNMEAARKRRPNAKGFNPCGEVILDSYGVCNLTTVNVAAFVNDGVLDVKGLIQAQALSVRACLRMTCLDLELPEWDRIQKRDRLIAASLTGWQDAMGMLNYTNEQEVNLLFMLSNVAFDEAQRYSFLLRIPMPLLCTTIKPEGTLSKVAGVSSGLHYSKAPYYIQRIRINANDPLAKLAIALNWQVHPEVGTLDNKMENARTIVIDFPVASSAKKTKSDVNVEEQFENYFMFQRDYTMHNSSITINVKPDEWDKVEEIIWNKWDDFIGVAFIADDGGSYLLAPEEECTEEEYKALKACMEKFDPELLKQFENDGLDETALEGADECANGACPIR
jgi:ribonucleoside-diphosphate reductase alpha chain/ribonucleoside-triphosphate reductase